MGTSGKPQTAISGFCPTSMLAEERRTQKNILEAIKKLWFFETCDAQSALDEECPKPRINERFWAFFCAKIHEHVVTFYEILYAPQVRVFCL